MKNISDREEETNLFYPSEWAPKLGEVRDRELKEGSSSSMEAARVEPWWLKSDGISSESIGPFRKCLNGEQVLDILSCGRPKRLKMHPNVQRPIFLWILRIWEPLAVLQGTESREESKSAWFATNWINGGTLETNSRQQKPMFDNIFNKLKFIH